MWKRIKEFFFRKEEINKVEFRHIGEDITSTQVTKFSKLTPKGQRVMNAKFKCLDCGKTVARLKNACKGFLIEYSPLKDAMFQLVKNQHCKNKNPKPFSLSDSGCHHCGSKNKLDHKVIWGK